MKRERGTAVAPDGAYDEHVVRTESERAQQPGTGDFGLQLGILCAVLHLDDSAIRQLTMKLLRASAQLLDDETARHFFRDREAVSSVRRKIELRTRRGRLGPSTPSHE